MADAGCMGPPPIRTIKDLDDAGHDLRLWCYACEREGMIDSIIWEAFVAKGWPIELDQARRRFKCKKCRSSRDVLLVAATRPKPDREITWSNVVHAWFFSRKSKRLFKGAVEERRR
ncbi:hypothetical protein [Tardibacter chloracetimidivorans]|nr:hypothetical protein [Tardibacter chloracetimidivorans]